MVQPNSNFAKLANNYLFAEIGRRVRAFQEANPSRKVYRLGIGDTTEPLSKTVLSGLHAGVDKLASKATYLGYGPEQGYGDIREALAKRYQGYGVTTIAADDIFISDGAKTDSANIQSIFAENCIIAVQDPAYPVYVDSNVIAGRTGEKQDSGYEGLVYLECTPENGFFPEPPKGHVDLIYICTPNNPTGAVATHAHLQKLVDYALANDAMIICDTAYAPFIRDVSLPRSIYEIKGAEQCAIEISSFSKEAGFTGVRLGWTVVPRSLSVGKSASGTPLEAGLWNRLWLRRQTTMFNGASNIVQQGGIAILSPEGQAECQQIIADYLDNAKKIRECFESLGYAVYGGIHAPFIWVKLPKGKNSWDFLDELLEKTGVVGTPGAGFGAMGEGFFRFSAFGSASVVDEAVAVLLASNLRLAA